MTHRTIAVAHFERTGCILPDYAGEVAAYRAEERDHDE